MTSLASPVSRSFGIAVALFVIAAGVSMLAMRDFRASGVRAHFYQSNFEPAVLMACGKGFGVTQPGEPAVLDFLHQRRDSLDCAELPETLTVVPLTAAAHASWYYLYGATAAVWRVTGVSWGAVDYLVAGLAGFTTIALYGLFRLVAPAGVAVALTLLLTLSPANLTQLMSLRDYSKAPFALAAIWILGVLVLKPLGLGRTVMMSALYGAVVGIGYGFRGDFAIMVPFGVAVVLALLPGRWLANVTRNLLAVGALLLAFAVIAYPVIRGLDKGGCQFHVALLGLTSPLTNELALHSPAYRFSDTQTDTFAILKTGDYATRVAGVPAPEYCDATYDAVSGQLYWRLAGLFPADFVVRAYGAVLSVLRWGLQIPDAHAVLPLESIGAGNVYWVLNRLTTPLALVGPVVAVLAVAVAAGASVRLGVALAFFVLFLCGYPAIQFEGRHWFHLRFIPWWAAVLVLGVVWQQGRAVLSHPRLLAGGGVAVILMASLALALFAIRLVQQRSATELFAAYESVVTVPLATGSPSPGRVDVAWTPTVQGRPHDQRASDLMVAQVGGPNCTGTGPLTVSVRYDAQTPSLDLSTDIVVARPAPDAPPTLVFVPVFTSESTTEVYQRFRGFEVSGGSAACIVSVGRAADRGAIDVWLQAVLTPEWRTGALYQTLRWPSVVRRLLSQESL